jgi:DNA topoisomerase-1
MNLRNGARGPWLGCSKFPKCRGRMAFSKLDEKVVKDLKASLAAHMKDHPIPIIAMLDGTPLTDAMGKPLEDAPRVEELASE